MKIKLRNRVSFVVAGRSIRRWPLEMSVRFCRKAIYKFLFVSTVAVE